MIGTELYLAALVLAVAALLYLAYRYLSLRVRVEARAREHYERWKEAELSALSGHYEEVARREAEVHLARWKREYEDFLRKDAVEKSRAVTVGKVTEHFLPYLPAFRYNPKDARFIGTPVDFIVFDGLNDGEVRKIAFLEVKTGTSSLSPRERKVRDAVQRGAVEWEEVRAASNPTAHLADGGSDSLSPAAGRQCSDCGRFGGGRFCAYCGAVL
jgi:predicted Holliday junction resolvase-like endonuclease